MFEAITSPLSKISHKLKAKGSHFLALVALAIVSLVWGTTWVVSKKAVLTMPALQMAGIRQLIGGACFILYFMYKRHALPKRGHFVPLIILSVLNFVLSNGLSTWGVKYIHAGLASIIGSIFPIWVVIIGLMYAKRRPSLQTTIGVFIGFIGICVIFYHHLSDFIKPSFSFGIMLSLIATWTWAMGTFYTKSHAKQYNPYFGLGFQMLLSGIILTVISAFNPDYLPIQDIPFHTWYYILYLVLFGSIIGFGCYLYALQHLPTTQTAIYAYVNPIIAIITGWWLLGEEITISVLTGSLITILGIYLINKSFVVR